jgi:hypothetical protein
MFDCRLRVFVRGTALLFRALGVRFGFFVAAFVVFRDGLEMVIGGGDVAGGG